MGRTRRRPVGGRWIGGLLSAMWACAPASDVAPDPDWEPSPPPLHHTHLNTVDAEAAIAWYQTVWPSGTSGSVAGFPAFMTDLPVLFTEVAEPPPGAWDHAQQRAAPQSPFWHIGGFVNTTDVFESLEAQGVKVLRLEIGPGGAPGVVRSGLTPYGGITTDPAGAEAADPREGGFGYVVGPDGALVELTGSPRTNPSFSHVHLFHERPLCAANWYVDNLGMSLPPRRDPSTGDTIPQVRHENCADAEVGPPGWPSLERGGAVRAPRAAVRHGSGSLSFYPSAPLVPSRGQVLDHIAFEVDDLDRWLEHLRGNGVSGIEGPYDFEATRAAMISGPDGLGIELVEATAR